MRRGNFKFGSDSVPCKIFLKMMNLRDDSGSWVEYYNSGMAMGCKCRPWESGVNIEAAIRYWEKK